MDSAVFQWVTTHGYALLFLAMAIEGPLVTAAAAFAASLGYFHPGAIILLSLAGDIVPDTIYYGLGFYGGERAVRRIGPWLRLPVHRLPQVKAYLERNQWRALAIFKYVPLIAVSGLLLAGITKMKFRKFLVADILVGIPNTLAFFAIGYFSGETFERVAGKIMNAQEAVAWGGAALLVLFLIYRFAIGRISRRLEHEITEE